MTHVAGVQSLQGLDTNEKSVKPIPIHRFQSSESQALETRVHARANVSGLTQPTRTILIQLNVPTRVDPETALSVLAECHGKYSDGRTKVFYSEGSQIFWSRKDGRKIKNHLVGSGQE